MKSRTRVKNRPGAQTPCSITWSWVNRGSAKLAPEMVRQGLNHSRPAVSVPMRACKPSETTRAAFMANSAGSSAL